jgi:hypothetical protein
MDYDLVYEMRQGARKTFLRTRKNWGRRYLWQPRANTVEAISSRRNMAPREVRERLLEERRHYEQTGESPWG